MPVDRGSLSTTLLKRMFRNFIISLSVHKTAKIGFVSERLNSVAVTVIRVNPTILVMRFWKVKRR